MKIGKVKDVRIRVLFVMLCMVILRLGAQIPIPFVDATAIRDWFASNEFGGLALINSFTGGSLENFSVMALSVTPYITATILIELLTVAFPKLQAISKDQGEVGRLKMGRITKYVAIGVASITALGLMFSFQRKELLHLNVYTGFITVVSMVAGMMFLMWLGDEITEKGIGNGVSVILMLNIMSKVPGDLISLYFNFMYEKPWWLQIIVAVVILTVIVVTIAMVVLLNDAKVHITVTHARSTVAHGSFGYNSSTFPIKLNTAGVIPVIFASTVLSTPLIIAGFFNTIPEWMYLFHQNAWFNPHFIIYSLGYLLYAGLVILFAYYYTAITLDPIELSNDIRKNAGVIPGIRPGKPTSDHLEKIITRLVPIGALWLLLIATVPMVLNGLTGAQISFGGTSIIIIVGVIVESLSQIDNMLLNRNYSGFIN